MLDFFNSMNEDGTLARLEEKYLGQRQTSTMLIPAPSRAVQNTLPDLKPLFEKYARQIDWRLLAAIAWQVALGSAGHLADRRARYDDANP